MTMRLEKYVCSPVRFCCEYFIVAACYERAQVINHKSMVPNTRQSMDFEASLSIIIIMLYSRPNNMAVDLEISENP